MRPRLPVCRLAAIAAFALAACDGRVREVARLAVPECVRCHGGVDEGGAVPAGASFDAAGAHSAHVVAGPFARALGCAECHPDPRQGSASHKDGTLEVAFGPLARDEGGPDPTYAGSGGRCSNVYCHGATLSGTAPSWTDGAAGATCGACHGIPPLEPHAQSGQCGMCHVGYTGTSVNLATHVNGRPDVAGLTCTSCHGRNGVNTAPPIDTAGRSATTLVSVGAHQAHVAPTLRAAIECTECHGAAAASYGTSHPDMTVQVAFGALANQGTATDWDGAAGTCAASYCHGGASPEWGGLDPTPVWTAVTGRYRACTSCHGDPPPLAAGTGGYHPQSTSCAGCHGSGFGPAAVDPAQHVNGRVALPQRTGACNRCHGSLDGYAAVFAADPNAIAAPGTPASSRSLAVGAHQAHVNPSGAAYAPPIHCTECHGADKLGPSDHADGGALPVWTSGTTATARGASPAYTSSSGACSSTYCHGKYATSTHGGATTPAPAWGSAGKLWCDACHGDPPLRETDGITAHSASTACSVCHAGYADRGADSRPRAVNLARHLDTNVDVAPPSGGSDCAICHGTLASAMRSTASGYHHLMSSSAATPDLPGGKYPAAALGDATDPQRRCLVCHVDHDAFGAGTRSSNLRAAYGATIAAADTDFDPAGGLCISCHHQPMAKSYPQADGSTQTPAIAGGATPELAASTFAASAHAYDATSAFSDGTTFKANCSKCHTDTMEKPKQTSANRFGLHDSTVSGMLDPAGLATGEPAEERFCTSCHSGGVARSDRYGATLMRQAAARFDPFVQQYTAGTISVAAAATVVTGAGTSWYSTGSGTFAQGSTVVGGAGTSWTSALIGRSIRNLGASPPRWYTIVAVGSPTSLVIDPAYAETTAAGATWATSIASWSIRCNADAAARWYSIADVTGPTSLAITPAYGGSACAGSAYVAVPSAGHPMQLTLGGHRTVEGGAAGWNGGASRHVTCADCHDPHEAQRGNHAPGSGAIAGPNAGAWGVVATWGPSRPVSGAILTNRSRTVTGAFLDSDAGKNMIGPDGLVYPIAAATPTTLTIGSTIGYKGGSNASATVTIEDPSTPPTFAVKPRLTSSDPQYRLCIKCHSAYGTSAPAPTAFFTAAGTGTTQPQTDMAEDINPNQLAYHPIAAVGRNQPPATANPSWASSAGRKRDPPNAGLDNTFVDGWGAGSRVACSDCHGSESTDDPWGPHGSANQWLLKGIDPTVEVTLASGAVTYPNACYYRGSTSVVRGVADTGDSRNFCLNCHRADVYGLVTWSGSPTGSSCSGGPSPAAGIAYPNLSRVNHPVDVLPHSNSVGSGALTRFGITCMQCHGGGSIGAIHGTNETSVGSGASHRGKRLLVGATWRSVTRATTNASTGGVRCWIPSGEDEVNTCATAHNGSPGQPANYDYDSGAD